MSSPLATAQSFVALLWSRAYSGVSPELSQRWKEISQYCAQENAHVDSLCAIYPDVMSSLITPVHMGALHEYMCQLTDSPSLKEHHFSSLVTEDVWTKLIPVVEKHLGAAPAGLSQWLLLAGSTSGPQSFECFKSHGEWNTHQEQEDSYRFLENTVLRTADLLVNGQSLDVDQLTLVSRRLANTAVTKFLEVCTYIDHAWVGRSFVPDQQPLALEKPQGSVFLQEYDREILATATCLLTGQMSNWGGFPVLDFMPTLVKMGEGCVKIMNEALCSEDSLNPLSVRRKNLTKHINLCADQFEDEIAHHMKNRQTRQVCHFEGADLEKAFLKFVTDAAASWIQNGHQNPQNNTDNNYLSKLPELNRQYIYQKTRAEEQRQLAEFKANLINEKKAQQNKKIRSALKSNFKG